MHSKNSLALYTYIIRRLSGESTDQSCVDRALAGGIISVQFDPTKVIVFLCFDSQASVTLRRTYEKKLCN